MPSKVDPQNIELVLPQAHIAPHRREGKMRTEMACRA